ncbi:hypothetical protein POX_f07978 [Penicillium oxalicum]|uniref:hypothetical protein n=1 Tax=Penicillium oxalicum TaxID=69781 RepID=UPI0020B67169|nr:hypothetical protein POX_f07978 [Penicillium oxalicum]KAI2787605.1 hypothetical protein POX_f07978 [Penicillium oxalicum]
MLNVDVDLTTEDGSHRVEHAMQVGSTGSRRGSSAILDAMDRHRLLDETGVIEVRLRFFRYRSNLSTSPRTHA